MDNPNTAQLNELIATRARLKHEFGQISAQIDAIDAELIRRLQQTRALLTGELATGGELPLPPLVPTINARGGMFSGSPENKLAGSASSGDASAKKAFFRVTNLSQLEGAQDRLWSRDVGDKIRSFATSFIRTHGPASTRELLEAMENSGFKVPGKSALNNLSAHLSRNDEFINTSKGWELRK